MIAYELIALLLAVGLALFATGLVGYGIWKALTSPLVRKAVTKIAEALGLHRAEENPIIKSDYPWEAGGVMNPAAAEAGGKTHLFYRAVGNDGVSRIGYASSTDGVTIDERLPYPVLSFDGAAVDKDYMRRKYPNLVASGGSWAGIEDPRAVVIDGRLYLSFSVFYGWHSLRIAVSSISVDDLLAKRWHWTPPVFLSPENEVHKNWVLFPERINGKFAVFHGLMPGSREHAAVAYLDTLERDPTTYVKSDARFRNEEQKDVWDSKIRGAGPPPVATEKGWLMMYHANDSREPHRYKLGAMLLDREDPTRVIARSSAPVLEPDMPYENEGKPGIVYACGATVNGDTLRVYYGGGDQVVCAAETSLSQLLEGLLSTPSPAYARA